MPEVKQLYANVEDGTRVAQATPAPTVTSSGTGQMQFTIQLPSPQGVPAQPEGSHQAE